MANYLKYPFKPQAVNISMSEIVEDLGYIYVAVSTDHLCKNHRVMYLDPKYAGYWTRHFIVNADGTIEIEDRASEHYKP